MIYLGAAHAGFSLKEEIQKHLESLGMEVENMGVASFNKDDDYPDIVFSVAKKVAESPEENKGIVLGRSGQGEAIAANKVKGVRAVVYYGGDMEIVELSREHNNANVLSIGAGFVSVEEAKEAVTLWLETAFGGNRHERRVKKISDFEQSQ
ncbi:MAG: RpiB/LacA/LacB family sugar-phosphate isomerase [Patescibacteria group bacterium]|nr:RpiB/LacA/LacB family sugar-phosphate isomerase [Patescibacteria group bacterium]